MDIHEAAVDYVNEFAKTAGAQHEHPSEQLAWKWEVLVNAVTQRNRAQV